MDSPRKTSSSDGSNEDRVAIIGMALRVPGANDADELWQLLNNGRSTLSAIPPGRFDAQAYRDRAARGVALKTSTGNFMDGLDKFDNEFFNISPREAKSMDPQQRLLLHVAYDALEDAGFIPHSSYSTDPDHFGVFIGAATSDYVHNVRDDIDIHYVSGTLPAFLSGRLSYALSLGGPSTVYDTACSSSGVALHAAVRALRSGDCRMALVGGVNAITSPDLFIGLDAGRFLSRTGQSRPFDDEADGYSRAEGCLVFILKRLSDALFDDDRILGTIRGIEVNQSYQNSSITRTHSPTQAALLRRLLRNCHLEATDIDVLEAHAAGTMQGDASELLAIRDVFFNPSVERCRQSPLYLSSIKATIGHLEAASGVASLAKVLLMLRHQTIPRQIGIRTLNPTLSTLPSDSIRIPFEPTAWLQTRDGLPRRAIVNNYGAAGSNVSILVENYAETPKADSNPQLAPLFVLGLSAKSEEALQKMRERHMAWLGDSSRQVSLLHYCYTSTARRQLYDYRLSIATLNDRTELIKQLKTSRIVLIRPGITSVVLVFPGYGIQRTGMGRDLYNTFPTFSQVIDECDAIAVEYGFPTILPYLVGRGDIPNHEKSSIVEQTALLSFQVALSKVWITWGVSPSAVIGHSLGEYAALVVSGVLSLKDALLLVGRRAQLVERHCAQNHSGMMAVALPSNDLEVILRSDRRFSNLIIACKNAERRQTVAGPLSQLEALSKRLHADHGIRPKLLPGRFAYHSPAMAPITRGFAEILRGVELRKSTLIVASTVTGRLLLPTDEPIDSIHLLRHCLDPVRFSEAVGSLSNALGDATCWIEVSSRRSMLSLVRTIIPAVDTTSVFIDPPAQEKDLITGLFDGISRLYATNVPVQWKKVFSCLGEPRCISLPPYPFKGTSFYVPYQDASVQLQLIRASNGLHSVPASSHLEFVDAPSMQNGHQTVLMLSADHVSTYSEAHRVVSNPVCPASIYIEAVLSAVSQSCETSQESASKRISIRHLEFVKPFFPEASPSSSITITLHHNGHDECEFTFHSAAGGLPRTLHARGQCQFQQVLKGAEVLDANPLLERVRYLDPSIQQGVEVFSPKSAYDVIFPRVVEYASSFRSLGRIVIAEDRSAGQALMQLPLATMDSDTSFSVHPALLDPMVHLPGFIVNLQAGKDDMFVCAGIGSVDVVPSSFIDLQQAFQLYTTLSSLTRDAWLADTFVLALDPPRVVAVLKNIQFKRVGRHVFALPEQASGSSTSISASSCESEPISPISLPSRCARLRALRSFPASRPSFRAILSSSLHIPEERIGDESALEAMGLDSLTSVEVLHTLRIHYNPTVSSGFFQEHPTVGEVEAALQEMTISRHPSTGAATADTNYSELLEQIQEGPSTRIPLCIIHDGSGLVSSYRKLANLGRPVWGIRAPDIEDDGWDTVEGMAASYAATIARHFPNGAILSGWSFGGVVAFEAAKQLLTAGFSVRGLVLLDAPPPSGRAILSDELIASVLENSKNGNRTDVLQHQLQRHARMMSRYRGTAHDSPTRLASIYVRCTEGYQAPPNVTVDEWYTKRGDAGSIVAEWKTLLDEDLIVLDVPGHHFEMFLPSRIATTSRAISQACSFVERG